MEYQLSSSKGRTIRWGRRCQWSSWVRRLPEEELFLLWCLWSRDESSTNRGTAWNDAQTFEIRIASKRPPSADTSNRFNENFILFPFLKSSIPSTFNEPGYLTFWHSLNLFNLGREYCWLYLENSLTNNTNDWSIFWVKGNLEKKLLEINRISQSD